MTFASGSTGTLALALGESFAGTVAGFAAGDAIDLQDFDFATAKITKVSGTGDAGADTVVTIKAGALTATITLLNDYANEFAADKCAYELVSDHHGLTPGTLLELATPHPV